MAHQFSEGDRVVVDYVRAGYHEDQLATVEQAPESQPHIVWVRYDDEDLRRLHGTWARLGPKHLRPASPDDELDL